MGRGRKISPPDGLLTRDMGRMEAEGEREREDWRVKERMKDDRRIAACWKGERARVTVLPFFRRPPRGGVRLPLESPLLIAFSSCESSEKSLRRGLERPRGPQNDFRLREAPGLRPKSQKTRRRTKMPKNGRADESLTAAMVVRTSPRHDGMWPVQPIRKAPYELA